MELGYHHSLWPGPLGFSVSPYHLQEYIPESCGELLEDMDPVWVDLRWSLRILIFNKCPQMAAAMGQVWETLLYELL